MISPVDKDGTVRHGSAKIEKLAVVALVTSVLAIVVGCRHPTQRSTDASARPAFKGIELYSWEEDEKWYFALVPGTNRIKTYAEISSADVRIQGMRALEQALDRLPEGEQVFWSTQRVPNTTLPPRDIVDAIAVYCRQRGIHLEQAGVLQPVVINFDVVPDDHLGFGDTVTANWSVANAFYVGLCYRYHTRSEYENYLGEKGGECFGFLPADGSQDVRLTPYVDSETYYVHFSLEALNGTPDPEKPTSLRSPILEDRADVHVPLTCAFDWFVLDEPRWCPLDPPQIVEATAQTFENGVMIHVPPDGPVPNAVYAYFHDAVQGRNRIASFYSVSPEERDAGLGPPEGMSVPDARFLGPWERRFEFAPLRDAIGWATAESVSFSQQTQCEEGPGGVSDHCYTSMPDGTVYQMDHRWTEWAVWE